MSSSGQELPDPAPSSTSVRKGLVDLPRVRHALECELTEFPEGDAGTGDEILHSA